MEWTKEAIEKLHKMRIEHRNWQHAFSRMKGALLAAQSQDIITLVGPSRSGKSKLINELIADMTGTTAWASDPDSPVVKVVLENDSTGGAFSTKSFATQALIEMKHPFYGESIMDEWDSGRFVSQARIPETILRPALRKALIWKRITHLVIDELQHVMHVKGGLKSSGAILDSWKSLAANTGIILILVGAYPMIEVLQQSPHALGREHGVHLKRYCATPEDLVCFDEVLEAFSDAVRLPKNVSSLRAWRDMLYRGSLGCIGLLNSWICDAVANAGVEESTVLRKRDFIETQKTIPSRTFIAEEIKEGEKWFEVEFSEDKEVAKDEPKKKRSSKKPFRKKAKRVKIGPRL